MKKLVIIDHLGNRVFEHDVFVEGGDFKWESSAPHAVWLGKILLVDEIPEDTMPKDNLEQVEETYLFEPVEEEMTEEEAKELAQVIQDDTIREVKEYEFEEVNNESGGNSGIDKTEQSESIEDIHSSTTRGDSTKRDKRTRNRKAS